MNEKYEAPGIGWLLAGAGDSPAAELYFTGTGCHDGRKGRVGEVLHLARREGPGEGGEGAVYRSICLRGLLLKCSVTRGKNMSRCMQES